MFEQKERDFAPTNRNGFTNFFGRQYTFFVNKAISLIRYIVKNEVFTIEGHISKSRDEHLCS